jgi:formylglycine-generating enzyme required for sulfatase activity
MTKIFISYRRADSGEITHNLYEFLCKRFGGRNVFKDTGDGNLLGGDPFAKVIIEKLNKADVVLIVIGSKWLNLNDTHGNRRLLKQEDWVRKEIRIAIENHNSKGSAIIPILVDGAQMPSSDELPEDIRQLCEFNACKIDIDTRYRDEDRDNIVISIKKLSRKRNIAGLIIYFLFIVPLASLALLFIVNDNFNMMRPIVTPSETSETKLISPLSSSTSENPDTTQTLVPSQTLFPTTMPSPTPTATATLISTFVPTMTFTPSSINTSTLIPTPSPTPTNTFIAIDEEFDGIEMVLVPIGCFAMGERISNGESTGGQQCFEQPFWIDKYEMTNGHFDRLNGTAQYESSNTNGNYPRNRISWYEANSFCHQKRAGRLPTEAEWEYAARGPQGWNYPWGDSFADVQESEIIFANTSNGSTQEVGSSANPLRILNQSWVGAVDMLGNVREWTNSIYKDYPYVFDDGREDRSFNSLSRVIRGGAWGDGLQGLIITRRLAQNPAFAQDETLGFRCIRPYSD